MIKDDRWTRANRSEILRSTSIEELPVGHPRRPRIEDLVAFRGREDDAFLVREEKEMLDALERGQSIWELIISVEDGLFVSEHRFNFASKAVAQGAQKALSVGDKVDMFARFREHGKAFTVGKLSFDTEITASGYRGEPPFFLVYEALKNSGVHDDAGLSDEVKEWLGEEGIEWLKGRFGENWEAVGGYEYSIRHFPRSSMAVCAARVLLSFFVAENGYDAGYASAELLSFSVGAEELAVRATEAQKRRTKASGERAKASRLDRIEALLVEIESLAGLVGLISEARLVEQAWENLQAKREDLPSTGTTRFSYEVTMRSEEPFRTRYRAVFAEKA